MFLKDTTFLYWYSYEHLRLKDRLDSRHQGNLSCKLLAKKQDDPTIESFGFQHPANHNMAEESKGPSPCQVLMICS